MHKLPISATEKYVIMSELATMLKAGIPAVEALQALINDAKGNSRKVLQTIQDDLNQGTRISDSLRKMPSTFDAITVNLISTGEEAGTLETSLRDIANGIKKDNDLLEKVKSALIYPLMVMGVFGGVMIIILTFVIPRVASVFSKLRVTLPTPTRILIGMSNALTQNTAVVLIALAVVVVVIVYLYQTKKAMLFNALSKLPVINKLVKEIDITRFAHTMHLLLVAGIPINKALELAQQVITQHKTAKALVTCREYVVSGRQLSEGMREHGEIFPGVMIRITEVGEKSGSLEESMQDITEYFDAKVSNSLKNLTVLLEPILILIVGVLIGGMMLAIVAPIYNLIGQIRSR
jgi:type II secretory pathway component PulF